jgi:hypothetical protein
MADVIKFEFNQPVEVALRFSEPRVFPPSDRFPGAEERHMFSTTDGRVMYVSPLTSARIKALHLDQGECFWICKRKDGRVTDYTVTRAAQPQQAPPAPVAAVKRSPVKSNLPERVYYRPDELPAEPPSELEAKLADSIALVERRKQPAIAERLAPAIAEFSARLVLETNALVDSYAAALKTASERHGNAIKPEDVRSLLVTAYISASKQGGRNAA